MKNTSWDFTGITKQTLQRNFKNLTTFIILFKATKGAGKPPILNELWKIWLVESSQSIYYSV